MERAVTVLHRCAHSSLRCERRAQRAEEQHPSRGQRHTGRCRPAGNTGGEHQDRGDPTHERSGQRVTGMLRLGEDPRIEIVRVEDAGQTLRQEQKRFRDAWLSSPARNTF